MTCGEHLLVTITWDFLKKIGQDSRPSNLQPADADFNKGLTPSSCCSPPPDAIQIVQKDRKLTFIGWPALVSPITTTIENRPTWWTLPRQNVTPVCQIVNTVPKRGHYQPSAAFMLHQS